MTVLGEQQPLWGLQVPTAAVPRKRGDVGIRGLATWAERTIRAISTKTGIARTSDMFVLTQAAKLTEELGELHAEILGRLQLQRSSKTRTFDNASLEGELADVVLCTAVLAQALGVDLSAAVAEKMDIVDSRLRM